MTFLRDYCGFAVFTSSPEGFKSLNQQRSEHSQRMLLSLPRGSIAFSLYLYSISHDLPCALGYYVSVSADDCELPGDQVWSLLFVTP